MTPNFYFKINLNKYGEIKLQTERENKTFRNAVIGFALGALIMFAGLLVLHNSLKKKVENRKQAFEKYNAELSKYEASSEYLSVGDVTNLAETFKNRIFWTKKLEALDQEIDNQVALKEFNYTRGLLTLKGIIEVDNRVPEVPVIDEFRRRLETNPEFSKDFPEILLGNTDWQMAKQTEILLFEILCSTQEPTTTEPQAEEQ